MAEQKELRRMSRTELIEIIYALQQQEQDLRREIKEQSDRLEDRAIRLESSGSIAEAALSLNHIFEDAQAAAEQYLMSVTDVGASPEEADSNDGTDTAADRKEGAARGEADEAADKERQPVDEAKAEQIIKDAKAEAAQIVADARAKAEQITAGAQDDLEQKKTFAQAEAEQILASAQAEAEQILASAQARSEQMIASAQFQADEIRRNGKQAVVNERDSFLREVRRLLDESPELAAAMRERARREDGV